MKDNNILSILNCVNSKTKISPDIKFIQLAHRLILYIIPVFLIVLFQGCSSEPVKINSGFDEPPDPEVFETKTWEGVTPGLRGSFGSTNERYRKSVPPDVEVTNHLKLSGWKGEILHTQILVWSASPAMDVHPVVEEFRDETGRIINSDFIQVRPVRYVITDEFLSGCGYRDADTIPSHLAADILDTLSAFNIPANSVRPIWVTISIPQEIKTGKYSGVIKVVTSSDASLQFNLTINIQNWTLPDPAKWSFHLDLWQNPYAVARYHKVEPWSQEHLEFMRPVLTLLAQAGQKCITTSIVDKPWGGQTYDPFQSMITWIKNSDGRWEFDYHVFDLYVSFAMNCGITQQISCYSMVPWETKSCIWMKIRQNS